MASDLIDGRLNLETCHFIDPRQAQSLRKGFACSGDVLLSHKATIGRVALVGDLTTDFVMLTPQVTYYRIRDPERLDSRYLRYYFDSPQFQDALRALAGSGSTRAYIGITDQLNLPILLCSIAEQRAVAAILAALDNKIELNRKMSATLEAIARALFKSWFVDFEPVRAKAEGRDTGLPPETAALFPNSFERLGIFSYPAGWKAKPVSEVVAVNPPTTLAGVDMAPYLDMANVPTQGFAVHRVVDRRVSSGSRFKNGDTLLARITPCLENGKTAFVDFLSDGQIGWGSTEFIVLRPQRPLPPEYGYLLARSDGFRSFAIAKMTGSSGRQRVPIDALTSYFVASPSKQIAKTFGDFVTPFFKRISAANVESRTLSELRDALLPRLISGELRISDAERILEKSA